MGIEDTFNGARSAFTFFDAYLNTVAQEIGMERALSLQSKMCETMGAMQGKMMKKRAGIEEIDAKAAWSLIKTVPESIGVSFDVVEESPRRVMLKAVKCPVYEAAQMLGMDAETLCRSGSIRMMDTVAKQLNPNLRFQLRRYRSGPNDFCEEELVLG